MEPVLRELFQRRFGAAVQEVQPLKGDGSSRRILRLSGGGKTAVGVLGPDRKENEAFLAFSRHFRGRGLPVPEVYAEDLERGAYLEEDLGDATLFDVLSTQRSGHDFPESVLELYRKAVRWLPRFQIDAARSFDWSRCYPRESFDRRSMLWDLNYFKYYFLRLAGVPFDEQALEDDFERFARLLLKAPQDFFLYRDFQSRNIMVRERELWFIDYQGGRRGALQYDLASLLYDAKADLPDEVREELLERYLEEASARASIDRAEFKKLFPAYVYIRIFQAMGAYGLRGFYERKTHFLQSIPYAVRNIEYLLRAAPLPVRLPALTGALKALVASSRLRQFGQAHLRLTVRVESFSYKDGAPSDDLGHGGGFVFDCRALPNPGRDERYAKLTGKDAPVAEYLGGDAGVAGFLEHAAALVSQSVESYRKRNFTDLLVAFGCTGGRHRSVYCAERLAERLRRAGVAVELRHRALEKLAEAGVS